MGTYTAQSGSVCSNEKSSSVNIQMIPKDLMSSDEIKRIPRGIFVILKTGCFPMKVSIPLFSKWGIKLIDNCIAKTRSLRKPVYIKTEKLKENILKSQNKKEITIDEKSSKINFNKADKFEEKNKKIFWNKKTKSQKSWARKNKILEKKDQVKLVLIKTNNYILKLQLQIDFEIEF